jgi:alpha-galactosidase
LSPTARFSPETQTFHLGPVALSQLAPVVDGQVPQAAPMTLAPTDAGWRLSAQLGEGGVWQLDVAAEDGRLRLSVSLTGRGSTCDALGVRFGLVHNAARFLRNGYTSWDGSFFVEPLAAAEHAGTNPVMA